MTSFLDAQENRIRDKNLLSYKAFGCAAVSVESGLLNLSFCILRVLARALFINIGFFFFISSAYASESCEYITSIEYYTRECGSCSDSLIRKYTEKIIQNKTNLIFCLKKNNYVCSNNVCKYSFSREDRLWFRVWMRTYFISINSKSKNVSVTMKSKIE